MKNSGVVFALLVATACTAASGTEQLLLNDDSCSMYDTCSMREFFRTCSCREDCNRYGTCCFDANSEDLYNANDFQCYVEGVPQPVYAKRTCAPDFQGEWIVKQSCENGTSDSSDLMQNILVSSSKSKITFKNWNCAICNGENATDLAFWTVQASCPMRSEHGRFEIEFIRRNISYHEDINKWGITYHGGFYNCSLDFYQPSFLMEHLRYCKEGLVSECPAGWRDEGTANKCRLYYGERKSRITNVYYRNVHCALCNGVQVSDLECLGRNYMPKFTKADRGTMRVVFNLNPWMGEHTKGHPKCPKNRRYDPFFRICRSLECGLVSPDFGNFCEPPDSGAVSLTGTWLLCLALIQAISCKMILRL